MRNPLSGKEDEESESGDGGRTVVVGIKMDSQSRELLTWALVKVAKPSDQVIALHVLDNNETVDPKGKSSLFAVVKAFDSVLAAYEGFCNLKQVDLKLKICRGTCVKKILVREANSYLATKVIVGTARNYHAIRSSISVAKYCAKKLPNCCSVLAVNNGKIVFQREASAATSGAIQENVEHRRNRLLCAIQKSFSKSSKLDNNGASGSEPAEMGLVDGVGSALKQNCCICAPPDVSKSDCCPQLTEEPNEDSKEETSLALVPVKTMQVSSSISSLIRERPGWPLLRRAFLIDKQSAVRPMTRQISVVQWALRLPTRRTLSLTNLEHEGTSLNHEDHSSYLNGENGAIVPVDTSSTSSPDNSWTSLPSELQALCEKYSSTCRLFKYKELLSATSNFRPENLIGKGGSSKVYKGCLPDGKELAVKTLKSSEDVLKEFVLEIEIITALNHKNIVSLFGFCFEDSHLLLVYDFLSRGSLEDNLYGNKKDTIAFGWNERYKVAVGVAEALDYLHNGSSQPVIHRDVKSSNILLSDDFEPQLSDFGLAKWASITGSHITCTNVAGTFGYLAPEYFMYGKINEKIDVYAFGVVLLELLSGRKPINTNHPKGQESLVMWAKPILDCGKVARLLDPNLGCHYDADQTERMVLAATLCTRRAPRARPQMSLILKLLRGDADVTKWARLQVNASEEFDMLDDEAIPSPNLQSHLNLALLDAEDSLSMSSIEQAISLEDYLRGRWSRSSSFD
ncbi:Protein kinase domain [Dillenia turbinata]|uniref:Protein kinase domain n=1 Tax=Dillenia turbinata TaxID=194707 RepID=A0AAN8ZN04_9MAGN